MDLRGGKVTIRRAVVQPSRQAPVIAFVDTDTIRGTGQTLQWLATDTTDDSSAWFVERRPDGATWQPGTQRADVTVTGPAGSLLLILTRRLPLTDGEATDISVDGDTELAQHRLDHTAHVSG